MTSLLLVLSWAQDRIQPWSILLIPAMITLALRYKKMTYLFSWAQRRSRLGYTPAINLGPTPSRRRVLCLEGSIRELRELKQVLERQESSERWAPVSRIVEALDSLMNALDGKTCNCSTTESLIGDVGKCASNLATTLRFNDCQLEGDWIEKWAVDLNSTVDQCCPGLSDEFREVGVGHLIEPLRKITLALETFQVASNWARLIECDFESIRTMMKQPRPWRGVECVAKNIAQAVLDHLQSRRDELQHVESQRKYVKCLRTLSKEHSILPSQLYFKKSAILDRDDFQSGGTFSDISRATLQMIGYGRQPVCLKRMRISGKKSNSKTKEAIEAFTEEAFIWRQLSHDNVLRFYGVCTEVMNYPSVCLISPWMEDGSVNDFLERNPNYDRLRMVWDIASGIEYLHGLDPRIIHKDIRGPNILVGPEPHHRCCLADFGITLIAETRKPTLREKNAGNVRWTAPELVLNPADSDPDLLWSADIYSFGCTIIEIYTGYPPYSEVANDLAVVNYLLGNSLPEQPSEDILPSALWHRVVRLCLSRAPTHRPTATEIRRALKTMDSKSFQEYLAMIAPEAASFTDEDDSTDDGSMPEEGA